MARYIEREISYYIEGLGADQFKGVGHANTGNGGELTD